MRKYHHNPRILDIFGEMMMVCVCMSGGVEIHQGGRVAEVGALLHQCISYTVVNVKLW